MNEEIKKHLSRLLDYVEQDEAEHFEECEEGNEKDSHIYHTIMALKSWLAWNK